MKIEGFANLNKDCSQVCMTRNGHYNSIYVYVFKRLILVFNIIRQPSES